MIRIAVFSDSHGDEWSLDFLLNKMGVVDAVCFLGDVTSDAMFLSAKCAELANKPPFYAVRGNNDLASPYPFAQTIEIGGKRIYMTHGHLCSSLLGLAYAAQEQGADIALFGHTHKPYCDVVNGLLVLNPGSAGNGCRGGAARASLLMIDNGRVRTQDVTLK